MADTVLPPTSSKAGDQNTHDEIWGRFQKFYSKNEKTLERCMNMDVRALAKGEKISEIEQQIDSFSETAKVVLDGLAELGKIHPVIGVAVVAFHAVISLDLTRRENDRKVIAIMVEMQNMMCAMFQLRHLTHSHVNDNEKDAERLHLDRLVKSITGDITQCGSDINYYLSQKFVLKLAKAWNFETRFKEHVATFAMRRSELQTAITTYIAQGVDDTNLTLTVLSTRMNDIDTKLDVIFETLLRKLDTPLERRTQEFLSANDGVKECIAQDELLVRLLALTGDVVSESEGGIKAEDKMTKSRQILQEELQKDFNDSLKQNALRFEKLLNVQTNNHERVIAHLDKQTGYQEVTVSKLDKLLFYMRPETGLSDPELRRIWHDMGLKTSVKAKNFVLTFRHHYQQTTLSHAPVFPVPATRVVAQSLTAAADFGNLNSADAENPDAWLLEYIGAAYVRPIVEAIDADNSGFISVKEINAFARSKPPTWSFLQWMVYWAAGWHLNILSYRDKIYDILIKMHEILPLVHPANQCYIDRYLNSYVVAHIEAVLRCTKDIGVDRQSPQLRDLALFYANMQQSALQTNLKEMSYIISSPADANLVAGGTRVEAWIYPFLYLLLDRHLAIMALAKSYILSNAEMRIHENSLWMIMNVFLQRRDMLQAIFSQISQNIASRFEAFAYGMFYASYKHDTEITPAKSTLTKARIKATRQNIILASCRKRTYQDGPADLSILALGKVSSFDYELLDVHQPSAIAEESISHPLMGYWCGVCFNEDSKVLLQTGLFHFSLSVAPDGTLSGTGESYIGAVGLTGHIFQRSSNLSLSDIALNMPCPTNRLISFVGIYDAERDKMYGNWEMRYSKPVSGDINISTGNTHSKIGDSALNTAKGDTAAKDLILRSGHFSFTRTPAGVFKYRAHLSSAEDASPSNGRRRWIFATEAVRYQVQTNRLSWDHVRKKFAERKLWVSLSIKYYHSLLLAGENDILRHITGNLHPAEGRLHKIISQFLDQRSYGRIIGRNISCDYCGNDIVVSRFRCITCMNDDLSGGINLCADDPKCIAFSTTRTPNNFVHIPSHTLLRSNYFIHNCDLAALIAACRTRSDDIKQKYRVLEQDGHNVTKATAISPSTTGKTTEVGQRHESSIVKPLSCTCCGKQVSLPCWVCATCAFNTTICLDCEKARATVRPSEGRLNSRLHSHGHPLLLIYDNKEIQSQEANNARLQQELSSMTADLRSLKREVGGHLESVTHVLQALVESNPNTKCLVLDTADAQKHNNLPFNILGDHYSNGDGLLSATLSFNPVSSRTLPTASESSVEPVIAAGKSAITSGHYEDLPVIMGKHGQAKPQVVNVLPSALTNLPSSSSLVEGHDDHVSETQQHPSIGARVNVLDARLDTLDQRISRLEKAVDGRFSGLEIQIGEILALLKKIPQS